MEVISLNREDFLSQLRMRLTILPLEAREQAMAYYESCFQRAGYENEQRVISELGSPEEIADRIIMENNAAPEIVHLEPDHPFYENSENEPEYTGYQEDDRFYEESNIYDYSTHENEYKNPNQSYNGRVYVKQMKGPSCLVWLLILIFLPVVGPFLLSLLGLGFGLIMIIIVFSMLSLFFFRR